MDKITLHLGSTKFVADKEVLSKALGVFQTHGSLRSATSYDIKSKVQRHIFRIFLSAAKSNILPQITRETHDQIALLADEFQFEALKLFLNRAQPKVPSLTMNTHPKTSNKNSNHHATINPENIPKQELDKAKNDNNDNNNLNNTNDTQKQLGVVNSSPIKISQTDQLHSQTDLNRRSSQPTIPKGVVLPFTTVETSTTTKYLNGKKIILKKTIKKTIKKVPIDILNSLLETNEETVVTNDPKNGNTHSPITKKITRRSYKRVDDEEYLHKLIKENQKQAENADDKKKIINDKNKMKKEKTEKNAIENHELTQKKHEQKLHKDEDHHNITEKGTISIEPKAIHPPKKEDLDHKKKDEINHKIEHEKEKVRKVKNEEPENLKKEKDDHLKKEKEEAERLKKEHEEKERLKKEHEEKERLKKEHEEKERLKKEKERLEKEEEERLKKEHEEKERLKKEKEEKERLEKEEEERLKKEQEETELLEKEKEEAERLKKEKERLKREHEEKERLRKEKEEAERLKKEKEEAERLKREKEEAEKLRKEKEEAEKLRKEKEEAERLKKEKEEAERLKKEQEEKAHSEVEYIPGIQLKEPKSKHQSTTKSETIISDILNVSLNPIQKMALNLEKALFGTQNGSLSEDTKEDESSDQMISKSTLPQQTNSSENIGDNNVSFKVRIARLDYFLYGVTPAQGMDFLSLNKNNNDDEAEAQASAPQQFFTKRKPRHAKRRMPARILQDD